MDIMEAISTRRSIRGYINKPVPKKTIMDILKKAVFAPSAVNTQPWEFTVVTGEALDSICRENVDKHVSGAPQQFPLMVYQGIYKERQVDLVAQIFKFMGISRDDREARAEWLKKGFRFFDAPVAIIVSMDKSVGARALFDLGAVCHSICLTALSYGIGTCIELQGVAYPETIRKYTGMPESKEIVAGIAAGYPDTDFPANNMARKRESVENNSTWCGFND